MLPSPRSVWSYGHPLAGPRADGEAFAVASGRRPPVRSAALAPGAKRIGVGLSQPATAGTVASASSTTASNSEVHQPSATHVVEPTTPSAVSPFAAWNCLTAASVPGPQTAVRAHLVTGRVQLGLQQADAYVLVAPAI